MQEKPLPAEKTSPFLLVLLTYLVLSPFAALSFLIPYFSPLFLILSLFLATLGAVGAVLVGRKRRRPGQFLFANAFFLLLLLLGARAWLKIVGNLPIWAGWMILIIASYILAWALPSINPKVSKFLWREQYTPKTRIGKFLLKIFAILVPIAGIGGAFLGMYSQNENQVMLFIGIAASLVSISLAQITAHQFWREDQLSK